MNFNYCPNCGGALESVSTGWICLGKCKGFVDMEGIVHKHRLECVTEWILQEAKED